jgi:chromatin segregation and condensation protein Rec8/ScpA/Scc1 (kleisin family)
MAKLSLNKAAKRAGVAKSTLLDALNTDDVNKKLSANKNARGHWEIEESELDRVFSKTRPAEPQEPIEIRSKNPENHSETSALQVEVKMLREQIERIDNASTRERDQMADQIANLREQIERQSADHRQALAVITDQRPTTPEHSRRRFFGLLKG